MTYTINKSDGTKLVDILDGAIDQTTDLKLIGKNSTSFVESLKEDLIFSLSLYFKSTESSATFYLFHTRHTTITTIIAITIPAIAPAPIAAY